jgi:pyruvate kinase
MSSATYPTSQAADVQHQELCSIRDELTTLRGRAAREPAAHAGTLERVHPNHRPSAENLLHYLSLRRDDLRPLQTRLAVQGLSSLGRAEPHVLATVDAVLDVLSRLTGSERGPVDGDGKVDFAAGDRLLTAHTDALFGRSPDGRRVRIMVTVPGDAADDYPLVRDLLRSGMDCIRINCAHDEPSVWARVIDHARTAERELGRSCRIVMDLAGPKLRTGPLQPGPPMVRIRPVRDRHGRIAAPARIWLCAQERPTPPPVPAAACLPVSGAWLGSLTRGDILAFVDARESSRILTVVDVLGDGCWAEATASAVITSGTVLHRVGGESSDEPVEARVGELPPAADELLLHAGDTLVITRDQVPGRPALRDPNGTVLEPARIGCTLPEVFDDVRQGQSVWFDDGRIGGVVEVVDDESAVVRITQTRRAREKLRGDKGINLPESDLRLSALTPKDIEDLEFVARHADVVELSFANRASDVEELQAHLARLGAPDMPLVLKIETRRAFQNLPAMLLVAMRSPSCGLMIARGDLAVESGFERLAELQEELLWICEAGHLPSIWATQVLETLAKDGMPSRAEITDAAMSERAECVMLNRGPHIVAAVSALDDILRRMGAHQIKKRPMLRALGLAQAFGPEPTTPLPR